MGLLEAIFGQASNLTSFLGELWFLVGIFIGIFFIIMLLGAGVKSEGITLFSIFFLLVISINDLFTIPNSIFYTIIVLLFFNVAFNAYDYLKRQ